MLGFFLSSSSSSSNLFDGFCFDLFFVLSIHFLASVLVLDVWVGEWVLGSVRLFVLPLSLALVPCRSSHVLCPALLTRWRACAVTRRAHVRGWMRMNAINLYGVLYFGSILCVCMPTYILQKQYGSDFRRRFFRQLNCRRFIFKMVLLCGGGHFCFFRCLYGICNIVKRLWKCFNLEKHFSNNRLLSLTPQLVATSVLMDRFMCVDINHDSSRRGFFFHGRPCQTCSPGDYVVYTRVVILWAVARTIPRWRTKKTVGCGRSLVR